MIIGEATIRRKFGCYIITYKIFKPPFIVKNSKGVYCIALRVSNGATRGHRHTVLINPQIDDLIDVTLY